jgi:two-component system, OmpR family, response regulator
MIANPAARILVVEDDPDVASALRAVFERESFLVTEARNSQDMQNELAHGVFDLITLDIGLPGRSGLDLAREVRRSSETPIIVISARSTDTDKIVGLEVGADDYIAKPFNVLEVIARVRAVLRRTKDQVDSTSTNTGHPTTYYFGNYQFNTQNRKLIDSAGKVALLTSAEGDLLDLLLQNAGQTCSRDEITSKLKGHEWSPYDRSLDTLVARLRRKIEPDPENPTLVLSVRGIGYRFTVQPRKK